MARHWHHNAERPHRITTPRGSAFAAPSAFVSVQALLDAAQDTLVRAHAQHRQVMAAIAVGDFEEAEALARAHATTALDNLEMARRHGAGLPLQSVPGIALVRQA